MKPSFAANGKLEMVHNQRLGVSSDHRWIVYRSSLGPRGHLCNPFTLSSCIATGSATSGVCTAPSATSRRPTHRLKGRPKSLPRYRKLEAARQQRQAKGQRARRNGPPAQDKSDVTNPLAPEKLELSRETQVGSAEEQPAQE